jgi:hypothetical protein
MEIPTANAGLGRQTHRADERGRSKNQFRFHNLNFLFFSVSSGFCRVPSLAYTGQDGASCRKNEKKTATGFAENQLTNRA